MLLLIIALVLAFFRHVGVLFCFLFFPTVACWAPPRAIRARAVEVSAPAWTTIHVRCAMALAQQQQRPAPVAIRTEVMVPLWAKMVAGGIAGVIGTTMIL